MSGGEKRRGEETGPGEDITIIIIDPVTRRNTRCTAKEAPKKRLHIRWCRERGGGSELD